MISGSCCFIYSHSNEFATDEEVETRSEHGHHDIDDNLLPGFGKEGVLLGGLRGRGLGSLGESLNRLHFEYQDENRDRMIWAPLSVRGCCLSPTWVERGGDEAKKGERIPLAAHTLLTTF